MGTEATEILPGRPNTWDATPASDIVVGDPVLETALAYIGQNVSVIPTRGKIPDVPWTQYRTVAPTQAEVRAWFPPGHRRGLGVVCGYGGIEMVEVEEPGMRLLGVVVERARETGRLELLERATAWLERSLHGGLHICIRRTGAVPGNHPIARAAGRTLLVETRGDGGQFIVAPTPGWTLLAGGPEVAAILTDSEYADLVDLFSPLNQEAPPPPVAHRTPQAFRPRRRTGFMSAGDHFDAVTPWELILEPHGWVFVRWHGQERLWRRPGKDTDHSATTGHAADKDRLWAYSTNTPFTVGQPYTKFGAYGLLNFGSDYQAAHTHLLSLGYGTPRVPLAS